MAFRDRVNEDFGVFQMPPYARVGCARVDVLPTVALRRNFRIRLILSLCISTYISILAYVVFVFFAIGVSETDAAPSQCETLEFLCMGQTGKQARNHEMTLEEIKALADRGNFDAAVTEIERFLKKNPDHVEGRLLLGVFLIWRGDSDRATDVFGKLADDYPDLVEPYNNLAAIHVANQRYREAEAALEKVIAMNPGYEMAWENLGDILAWHASSLYERATKLYAADEHNGTGSGIDTGIERKSVTMRKILGGAGYSLDGYSFSAHETLPPGEANIDVAITEDANNATATPTVESPYATCYFVVPPPDRENSMSITKWFEGHDISTTTHAYDIQKPHGYEVFALPSDEYPDLPAFIQKMHSDGIRNTTPIFQGNLQHSVMIGVFDTESAAKRRINELWKKGYKAEYRPSIRIEKRYRIETHPADSPGNKLAFAKRFPTYGLRAIPCE